MLRDLRYALRTLRRKPAFAVIAVATAALGIGFSTAIFSAVNGVLLRPLPYPDPDSLVYVGSTWTPGSPAVASIPDFIDWRDRITSLDALGAVQPTSLVLVDDAGAERVPAARVSPEFFSILDVTPAIGRLFSDNAFRTGAAREVLLSHGLWQRRLGGDPNVLGRVLRTARDESGEQALYTVLGVLPAGFRPPPGMWMEDPEAWTVLPLDAAAYASNRTSRSLRLIGRMRDGSREGGQMEAVGLATAQRELDAIAAAMRTEFPGAYTTSSGVVGIGIVSLLDKVVGETGNQLIILFGATGFLLLMSCVNVANLLLARAGDRRGEIAVRSALGAGRRRIVGQLLTESLLLGLLGGVVGVGVAYPAIGLLCRIAPADFPRLAGVTIDPWVLGFAIAISLLSAVVFGLAPAIATARADVAGALSGLSGRTTGDRSRGRARGALVGAEVALALVLLTGAGLLIASLVRLRQVDPGFDASRVVMTEVGLPDAYSTDEQRGAYFDRLLTAARALPGVESATLIPDPPLSGFNMWAPRVFPEDVSPGVDSVSLGAHLVGPDYLATLGIRLLRGRDVTIRDAGGAPRVAVLSEMAARQLWPDKEALGKRIRLSSQGDEPAWTVVGIAADVLQNGLAQEPQGEVYVPYAQNPWFNWNYLMLRTDKAATSFTEPLRKALRDLDPAVPFDGVGVMSDRVSASLSAPGFLATLSTIFAWVALCLAVAGIYATVLQTVGQRTREIGLRMALGARPRDVLRLVMRQAMLPAVLGLALGLVGTLGLSRVMASLVFGIAPSDPSMLGAATVVLALAAGLACFFPARRAARLDPLRALRAE